MQSDKPSPDMEAAANWCDYCLHMDVGCSSEQNVYRAFVALREELEEVRADHRQRIASLQSRKGALEIQLDNWKRRALKREGQP